MIRKWYQEGVSTSGKLWGRTFWVEETTEASSRDGRTQGELVHVWFGWCAGHSAKSNAGE